MPGESKLRTAFGGQISDYLLSNSLRIDSTRKRRGGKFFWVISHTALISTPI
jgi:hypothetical protein